jgi:hypothetical protein
MGRVRPRRPVYPAEVVARWRFGSSSSGGRCRAGLQSLSRRQQWRSSRPTAAAATRIATNATSDASSSARPTAQQGRRGQRWPHATTTTSGRRLEASPQWPPRRAASEVSWDGRAGQAEPGQRSGIGQDGQRHVKQLQRQGGGGCGRGRS